MIAVAVASLFVGGLLTLWTVLLVHARRHRQTCEALATWRSDRRAYYLYKRGLLTYEDYLAAWRTRLRPPAIVAHDGWGGTWVMPPSERAYSPPDEVGVARGGEGHGGLTVD